MTSFIRTVIIDDYPIAVAGARALIDGVDDIICVGEAGNAADALSLIDETQPDIAVLDMGLADINGLILAERILSREASPQVVMTTWHDELTYVEDALRIGVLGFVQKRAAEEPAPAIEQPIWRNVLG